MQPAAMSLLATLCWSVLDERNSQIFLYKANSVDFVAFKALRLVMYWSILAKDKDLAGYSIIYAKLRSSSLFDRCSYSQTN